MNYCGHKHPYGSTHQTVTHPYNRIIYMHWRIRIVLSLFLFVIELWKNLAIEGIATQSSNYKNSTAHQSNDGNPDANYYHGSCSHTLTETDPWWRVTFKGFVLVKEVIIVNRADYYGMLTNGFIFTIFFTNTYDSYSGDILTLNVGWLLLSICICIIHINLNYI